MTEWREVVLGDLCDRVTVGHVGKMASEYVKDGVLFVRSQNVKPFSINPEGMLQVSEAFHQRIRKSTLRKGDVVVVRTGYPGTAAVVPPELDGSNCADLVVITPSAAQLNPHMLAAVFNSAWGRSTVSGQLVGSAQQHFNVGSAKALRVRLPDKQGQDQIALILCGLNDLMENNQRRIELLEQMAQAIYREWFVRFRYPGHQDATLVDSALGPIPAGWTAGTIDEVTSVISRGVAPKYEDSGPWTVVNQRCIRDSRVSLDLARRQERSVPVAKCVRFGDVLINSTGVGTLGRVAVVLEQYSKLTVDSHVTIVRPKDADLQPWFGLNMLQRKTELEAMGVGSTGQTELGRKEIGRLSVVTPSNHTLSMFADLAWPFARMVPHLLERNRNLAAIRELLLPKLVTGQIDVSKLDLDALVDSTT